MKISWQVTGARQDAYAKAHPLQVEQDKTGEERGKYLNPIEYGKTVREGIGAASAKIRYADFTHKTVPIIKPGCLTTPNPLPLRAHIKKYPHKPNQKTPSGALDQ